MILPVQTTPPVSAATEPPANTAATPRSATAGDAASTSTPVGRANPTFQFDPAAGVLVIQFRDDSGKIDLSIPSQQQLDAYTTDRVEGQQPSNSAVIA